MRNPYIFGIRHLSPAGAWHLRQFLDEKSQRLYWWKARRILMIRFHI